MTAVLRLSLLMLVAIACQPATPTPVPPTPSPVAATPATGVLAGRVTVGPLQPVERIDAPTPTVPPEVYTSRAIEVFQADGTTLVTRVPLNPDGTYRISLAPGVYVVNIAPNGLDRSASLPQTVTVESGQTVQLDFDVDTGIR